MTTRTLRNDGFDQPTDVPAVALAFGGDMSILMPDYATVPEDFKRWRGQGAAAPWCEFVTDWFFKGVQLARLTPRTDVDPKTAINHAKAIMASWEPKHEHKEAAVAWLLSRWFEAVTA
jgi:hypothetical protein